MLECWSLHAGGALRANELERVACLLEVAVMVWLKRGGREWKLLAVKIRRCDSMGLERG